MSPLSPAVVGRSVAEPESRLRLLAVALCSWRDFDPVTCSRSFSGSESEKAAGGVTLSGPARDALLLKLERVASEDEQLSGFGDDGSVVAIDRKLRARSHPFWSALERAFGVLRVLSPAGARLVWEVYVEAGDSATAMLRANSLKYLAGGQPGVAVLAPRYELVEAMRELDELLRGRSFPPEITAKCEGWEEWLAAARSKVGTAGKPAADARRSRRLVQDLVREASAWGFSQTEIAKKLGLQQPLVSKWLKAAAERDSSDAAC